MLAFECLVVAIVTITFADGATDNHVPSFTAGPDVSVPMNAPTTNIPWATAISDGEIPPSQTLEFVLSPNQSPLFKSGVSISTAGVLTFSPADDVAGSIDIYVTLHDSGDGTCTGCDCSPNCDRSITTKVTITIVAVNKCPYFTLPATSVTLAEDSPAYTQTQFVTKVNPGGPTHELSQTLTFDVTTNNPALFKVRPNIAFVVGSLPQGTGTLTFEPASDAVGTALVYVTLVDSGGTAMGGCDRSALATFTIILTAVNDLPTFVAGSQTITVKENSGKYIEPAWATRISPGPFEEQVVSFTVKLIAASHESLFLVLPAIDEAGTLTFAPGQDKNTKNVVVEAYVQLRDDQKGESCSLSAATITCEKIRIVIIPVNTPPYFTPGVDITVWEDRKDEGPAGSNNPHEFQWGTGISTGNPEEDKELQEVFFEVTYTNANLFTVVPTLAVDSVKKVGKLAFELQQYRNGACDITVTLYDKEDANQRGNMATFRLNVLASNNAPVFTFAPTQPYVMLMNTGEQQIQQFIADLAPGPVGAADEATQAVWTTVTGSPAYFFSQQPTVKTTSSTAAKVSFVLADNVYGDANITVSAHDDGGMERRGVNSFSQTFRLFIARVNLPPTFVIGRTAISNKENEFPQGATVTSFVTQISPGLNEFETDAEPQSVTLAVAYTNEALFAAQKFPRVAPDGSLSYTVAPDSYGSSTITVTAKDDGTPPLQTSQTAVLTITPVNHAPHFDTGVALTNGTLTECRSLPSCSYTFAAWATTITPGPANEAAQVVHFVIDTGNAASLFATHPAIEASTGKLSFALAPYKNTLTSGPLSISISLLDDGGVSDGGTNKYQVVVPISVSSYTDTPRASLGAAVALRRNGPRTVVTDFLTGIFAASGGVTALDLNFTVTVSDPDAFTSLPKVTATSTTSAMLEATPAPHFFGRVPAFVRVHNTATAKFTQIEFAIDVTYVNEAPYFELNASTFSVAQGSGSIALVVVQNISVGWGEAQIQTSAFSMTCTVAAGNVPLFASAPVLDVNGVLRTTLLSTGYGSAECTTALRDTGGVANGGQDSYGPKKINLVVTRVNHAPTFVPGSLRLQVLENSGQFRSQWASSVSAGAGDGDLGQVVTFALTCSQPTLFSSPPTVDALGVLSFTPNVDTQGESSCTIHAEDSGRGDPPHVNCSATVTLRIEVLFVNQAPRLTVSRTPIAVVARSEKYSYPNFITNVSAGPASEDSQHVSLSVAVVSGSALFAIAPFVLAGVLSFATNPTASGVATVQVCVTDDGGSSNGGQNRLCTTFAISIVSTALSPDFSMSNLTVFAMQRAGAVGIDGFLQGVDVQSGTVNSITVMNFVGAQAIRCASGFVSPPTVSATTLQLQFAAKPGFWGRCDVSLSLVDTVKGVNRTAQFQIAIVRQNLQPKFTPGPSNVSIAFSPTPQTISWATLITPGDDAELDQVLHGFVETSDPVALHAGSATFNATSGAVTLHTASNEPAVVRVELWIQDDGGTSDGGVDTSIRRVLYVQVIPVNTAPTFSLPTSLRLSQSPHQRSLAFASAVFAGTGLWESTQGMQFIVQTNNTEAFTAFPTIDSRTGVLTFATLSTFSGVINFIVALRDNGGVADGGRDTSAAVPVPITIMFVNSAPTFTVAADPLYVIQGEHTTVPSYLVRITAGRTDEEHQVLLSGVVVDTTSAEYVAAFSQLRLDNVSALTIQPARFFSGAVSVLITISDDGGVENDGSNSATQPATIVVLKKNAPPIATVRSSISISSRSTRTWVSNFATEISAVEVDQFWSATLTTSTPDVFVTLPELMPNGTLVFELVPSNLTLQVDLVLRIRDNGGTANGGNDTSYFPVSLLIQRPPTAPTFKLLRRSVTVSTLSSSSVALLSDIVPNAAGAIQLSASTDMPGLAAPLSLSLDGSLFIAAGGAIGMSLITVTLTNADGMSASTTVSLTVAASARILIQTAGEVATFSADAFRSTVASIFQVAASQVVVVSVTPGSVRVVFYISGLQPSLSSQAFVERASDPGDSINKQLAVEAAVLADSPMATFAATSPSPSTTNQDTSTAGLLGLSWIVWVIILIVVVAVIALVSVAVACACLRRNKDKHHDEKNSSAEPTANGKHLASTSKAAPSTVYLDIDDNDDATYPRRAPTLEQPQDDFDLVEDDYVDVGPTARRRHIRAAKRTSRTAPLPRTDGFGWALSGQRAGDQQPTVFGVRPAPSWARGSTSVVYGS
jgi:hypothetical protein